MDNNLNINNTFSYLKKCNNKNHKFYYLFAAYVLQININLSCHCSFQKFFRIPRTYISIKMLF